MTARALAAVAHPTRRLRIHLDTMTGILARLADSGWIERTSDPGGRRPRC